VISAQDFGGPPAVVVGGLGTATQVSATYTVYTLPGYMGNYNGVFEVGVDVGRFLVPTITHWLFRV
jgi:hypothetical protein